LPSTPPGKTSAPGARPELDRPRPLRIATYNVEWFNLLFDDEGHLQRDKARSARHQITRAGQIAALGAVFRALDADGVMVIEAPDTNAQRSTVRALETFAAAFGLRSRRAVIGFASGTEQEIAFLFDPDRLAARHAPQASDRVPRFDTSFVTGIGREGTPDKVRFDKPPLELAVSLPGGMDLRLIGVHAKSKAAHHARNPRQEAHIARENRRKQLGQCLWLRACVVEHLTRGDSVIVLGDFNDGPGLDSFEQAFGRSGVEIVMAPTAAPRLRLTEPHAAAAIATPGTVPAATARFWLDPQKRYFDALVDFVMLSPGLAAQGAAWRIWHPLNDPAIALDTGLAQALLTASDHFPVSVDLPIVN